MASLRELQVCSRIQRGFARAVAPPCGTNVTLLDADNRTVCAVELEVYYVVLCLR